MNRVLLGCALAAFVAVAAGCGDEKPSINDPDAGPRSPDAGDQTPDAGPTVPLERAYAGGHPDALALADGYAYITVGSHVEIWSLANPAQPALVGQTQPVGTLLGSIAVSGDRAYVVQSIDLESVIHILDISDPSAPRELGTFRAVDAGAGTSVILDLAVADGKLYAADMEQGIHVFDISNPNEPVKVTLIAALGISAVQPEGDRLYYFSEGFAGSWFGILDAANGYAEIGGTSLFGTKAARLVNGLLVTIGTDGIQVFQFDPANPWTATEVYRVDNVFARALTASGTTVWIPGFDGLHVVDASDPAAIAHVGPLSFPVEEGDAIAAADGLLVTATGRGLLVAIDVSSITEPQSKSNTKLSVCTNCASLATDADGTLFIADVASGLKTARLRDFGELGRGTVPEQVAMEDVVVSNGIAYLSDWFYGLRIFDVSNPSNPALLSSMITGGYASSVAVEGNKVIIGETTNGGMIRVIDVSTPTAPVLLGSAPTTKARDVELRGNLVFVADEGVMEAGGMRIFDISNPQAILELSHYTGCANVIDLALAGNVAVLACSGEGVQLVDMSTPAAPQWLATFTDGEMHNPESVAVNGDRAYVGSVSAVIAVDISNPRAPAKLASWPVAYPARGMAAPLPGRVVAACGLGGLYQWELK